MVDDMINFGSFRVPQTLTEKTVVMLSFNILDDLARRIFNKSGYVHEVFVYDVAFNGLFRNCGGVQEALKAQTSILDISCRAYRDEYIGSIFRILYKHKKEKEYNKMNVHPSIPNNVLQLDHVYDSCMRLNPIFLYPKKLKDYKNSY